MVEYLTDWVMGTSNQAADDDIKCLTRYSPVYVLQSTNTFLGTERAPSSLLSRVCVRVHVCVCVCVCVCV